MFADVRNPKMHSDELLSQIQNSSLHGCKIIIELGVFY